MLHTKASFTSHELNCVYNTQFLLYPRPLTCQTEFLLFYMCQLWALHVVIKHIRNAPTMLIRVLAHIPHRLAHMPYLNDRFLHLYLHFFY